MALVALAVGFVFLVFDPQVSLKFVGQDPAWNLGLSLSLRTKVCGTGFRRRVLRGLCLGSSGVARGYGFSRVARLGSHWVRAWFCPHMSGIRLGGQWLLSALIPSVPMMQLVVLASLWSFLGVPLERAEAVNCGAGLRGQGFGRADVAGMVLPRFGLTVLPLGEVLDGWGFWLTSVADLKDFIPLPIHELGVFVESFASRPCQQLLIVRTTSPTSPSWPTS